MAKEPQYVVIVQTEDGDLDRVYGIFDEDNLTVAEYVVTKRFEYLDDIQITALEISPLR